MIDALRASYREEATELLSQLESALLELETSPGDAELISRVFRALHTIKGSGAMFGFDSIASFTHEAETTFDLVRSGALPAGKELITLALESADYIRTLLNAAFGGPPAEPGTGERILAGFRACSSSASPLEPGAAGKPEPVADPSACGCSREYQIRFNPSPDIFLNGTSPRLLLRELRDLGACTITADTSGIPELDALEHERCYVWWSITLATAAGENTIRDVFIFVEDDSRLDILSGVPDSGHTPEEAPAGKESSAPIGRSEARGEPGLPAGPSTEPAPSFGRNPVEPAASSAPGSSRERRAAGDAATIRVSAGKLDSLVDSVGELVTAQARLSRVASRVEDTELEFVAEEMERLIDLLRVDTMSMRMLPLGSTFARFRRLVRDLSRELGKEVDFKIEGGDTELDKNVIEQLNDPLVHLIRNCVDHGIESPAERAALGKPALGTVHLSAVHSGAHVLIRIADDGAGLDREAILRKAVERGLAPDGAELSDAEICRLVFAPGFSTASRVTEVSGRGVGLDVVERGISALRGSVDVRSRRGEGTVFTLKLPLTLAIIDGLLVSVGSERFIIPVSNSLECVELNREARNRARGRRAIVVRDELIPYVPLQDYFGIAGEPPAISQVILVETEYGKFGLLVDRVIGDHQTVIKSLGRVYGSVVAISGATILGDGSLALILDPDKLVREVIEHA